MKPHILTSNSNGVAHCKGKVSNPHGDWSAFLLQRRYLFIWFLAALIPFALVRAYFSYSPSLYSVQTSPQDEDHAAKYRISPVPAPLEAHRQFNVSSNREDSLAEAEHVHNPGLRKEGECDLSRGDWIPDSSGPFYTNETCRAIQEHQNCMKHGRPDTGYLHWRWKPDSCELPRFNASSFLKLVHSKLLAFVGDSIGRNHMQSLVCLLSQVG